MYVWERVRGPARLPQIEYLGKTRNLVAPLRRSRDVRILAIALCVAAIAAPAAFAKGQITVSVTDRTPRVGQAFTVDLRTGWVVPANDWLRADRGRARQGLVRRHRYRHGRLLARAREDPA